MGWKTINGSRYYYSSERVRGRVVTTYRGNGEAASLIARYEAFGVSLRESERAKAKAAETEAREKARREDAEAAGLDRALSRLAEWEMEEAGYHKIKRGPWRRRRTMDELILAKRRRVPLADLDAANLLRRYKAGEPEAVKEYGEIHKAVRAGDREGCDQFRELYRADPEEFRATTDSIVLASQDEIVAKLLPKTDNFGRIVLDEYLLKMTADLEGPDPSPIERILAGRVTMSWLQAYRCDYEAIKAHNEQESIKVIGMRIHRQDRAHRRLLSAIKALAEVRNLPLLRVQVSLQGPPAMQTQTALEAQS